MLGRSTASRPLILLSPYKFRATKSLYSFRVHEILRARYRAGNTRAVWPDRVTIRAPGHSFKTSSLHKSKLAKCDRAPTLPPPPSSILLLSRPPTSSIRSNRIVESIELNEVQASLACFSFSKAFFPFLLSLSLSLFLSILRIERSLFFRFEVIVPN